MSEFYKYIEAPSKKAVKFASKMDLQHWKRASNAINKGKMGCSVAFKVGC